MIQFEIVKIFIQDIYFLSIISYHGTIFTPPLRSQTRFLLCRKFNVTQGEEIRGTFTMVKSEKNFRDLDMSITLHHESGHSGIITDLERSFNIH